MLKVATVVKASPIHGLGCFAGVAISRGAVVWQFVWVLQGGTDEEIGNERWFDQRLWEWQHAYKSTVQRNIWVLCHDNAAYMNFSANPNLREGRLINREPCLVARRDIMAGEELTVGMETDGDAEAKLLGVGC